MDPKIRDLCSHMFDRLTDAWHTAETATALTTDQRDALFEVAAWGGDEDMALEEVMRALLPLAGDDPDGQYLWRTHVTRDPEALTAHLLWGARVVGQLRRHRDELAGNLDVEKAEALRDELEERTATRLHALLGY